MTGFLDRILNGDRPRPLDVDTAAAMLRTTPGLLREFERSYHANVLDRREAPTGPLGPDARSVIASRSGHDLSDAALSLDARIVRELLADTSVIRYDGERVTTIPALAPTPESYVTEADVDVLEPGERPQLAGELIHRQIDAVNYPLLLDMWRRATDPKRSARQRREAYGMFRTGLDLLDLDPVMYRMLDLNPAGMGHWLPALVKANEGKTFFRIPKTVIAKAPLTLLQLSRVEYESLTAATLESWTGGPRPRSDSTRTNCISSRPARIPANTTTGTRTSTIRTKSPRSANTCCTSSRRRSTWQAP